VHSNLCHHYFMPGRNGQLLEKDVISVLIVSPFPTQWQGPLFKYISNCGSVNLEVIFLSSQVPLDSELNRVPEWDDEQLYGGFNYLVLGGGLFEKLQWLARTARRDDLDIIVIPGWALNFSRAIILLSVFSRQLRAKLLIHSDSTDISNRA